MSAHLIHEHKPPTVELAHHKAPHQPQPLVSLAPVDLFFGYEKRPRLIARQIVASLTSTPQIS